MKIHNKLFLVLFGFSLLLVVGLVSIMQWSINRGMIDYVNSKEVRTLQPVANKLAIEYRRLNSWDGMFQRHDKFRYYIDEQLRGTEFSIAKPKGEHKPRREGRPPPQQPRGPMSDSNGPPPHDRLRGKRPTGPPGPPPHEKDVSYALLDTSGQLVVGRYPPELEYSYTAIKVEEKIVGRLAVSKRKYLTQDYEIDFVKQQQSFFGLIALTALSLVALITFPLTRHLVIPIKKITSGMRELTQGAYHQKLVFKRKDEVGELSEHFNELAHTLKENESSRKRWLANTSHELRTPVAILRGELEAMLDEVRPLTKENVASVHDEVKHLQRLIDDLNVLASADIGGLHYRKQKVDLTELLKAECAKYTGYLADANITLDCLPTNEKVSLYADRNRLCQLFENIINNCIKYAKATSLKIRSEVHRDKNQVVLTFADNGMGVDSIHLPNLFEHLYRAEDSRNRKTGGSGLGLAICRQITIGHQGEIHAEKTTPNGLTIVIRLPII
jgi:two-component system, OmpR family, sensor histidine kinase BaeS